MIANSYEEWKDCIVNKCKIPLTKEFVQERLIIYQDGANSETKKFASLYGEAHLNNIIHWLNQALNGK